MARKLTDYQKAVSTIIEPAKSIVTGRKKVGPLKMKTKQTIKKRPR